LYFEKYARLYIKDIIYGANDGIITTFAVVASIEGAGLSVYAILAVGFASLFADGISMASSSYLATKSDKEVKSQNGGRPKDERPLLESIITFMSFITAGSVPLVPYIFLAQDNSYSYAISALTALSTLFLIGGLRTRLTRRNFIWAGLEMSLLGIFSGAIAYLIGTIVSNFN
jgi:Uncharacterized membrane protein